MTYFKSELCGALSVLFLGVATLALPEQARADSDPYLGEIAPMSIVGFCPVRWASAEGQLLPITQNEPLFALIGTTFGGDGRTTFGLPDLRGRIPMGQGSGPGLTPKVWGQTGGQERLTLTTNEMAAHSHTVHATNSDGNFPGPGGKILGAAPEGGSGQETIYSDQAATVQMSPLMIAPTGQNLPVAVQDPTVVIRYCIALEGVFPSRN